MIRGDFKGPYLYVCAHIQYISKEFDNAENEYMNMAPVIVVLPASLLYCRTDVTYCTGCIKKARSSDREHQISCDF